MPFWRHGRNGGSDPWGHTDLVSDVLTARICAEIERGEAVHYLTPGGSLRVHFDLQHLDERWRDFTLDRLEGHSGPAKLIYRYQGAWAGAVRPRGLEAAYMLERLLTFREVARIPLVQYRHRDPTPAEDAHPMLRASWRFWDRTKGLISEGAAGLARFLPFMQISLPSSHGERSRFFYVGNRTTCAMLWNDWTVSQSVASESIPDRDLEDVTIGAYRQVLESNEPRLDDITAPIARADGEYAWLPYRRLILPCRLANGRPAFNCATRFLSGPAAAIPAAAW